MIRSQDEAERLGEGGGETLGGKDESKLLLVSKGRDCVAVKTWTSAAPQVLKVNVHHNHYLH